MDISAITGAMEATKGGLPYVQMATTALNLFQGAKASSAQVKQIGADARQQIGAAQQATEDYNIQSVALRQQQALALQRDELAQRAEAESLRQSRLAGPVEVSAGPSLASQREARLRRRQFFTQEA